MEILSFLERLSLEPTCAERAALEISKSQRGRGYVTQHHGTWARYRVLVVQPRFTVPNEERVDGERQPPYFGCLAVKSTLVCMRRHRQSARASVIRAAPVKPPSVPPIMARVSARWVRGDCGDIWVGWACVCGVKPTNCRGSLDHTVQKYTPSSRRLIFYR
jgi:hypothetical protein